jgi:hypothetical protein
MGNRATFERGAPYPAQWEKNVGVAVPQRNFIIYLADNSGRAIMDKQRVREQVDKNYEAFRAMLPTILPLHQDKYALMKDGAAVGFYSTLEDAYTTANQFYKDEPFSVQKVTDTAVDLGFFSHAVPCR